MHYPIVYQLINCNATVDRYLSSLSALRTVLPTLITSSDSRALYRPVRGLDTSDLFTLPTMRDCARHHSRAECTQAVATGPAPVEHCGTVKHKLARKCAVICIGTKPWVFNVSARFQLCNRSCTSLFSKTFQLKFAITVKQEH